MKIANCFVSRGGNMYECKWERIFGSFRIMQNLNGFNHMHRKSRIITQRILPKINAIL